MKKKQNHCTRASALQITLALALISISAILLASSLSQSTGGVVGLNNPQTHSPVPDLTQLVRPLVQNMTCPSPLILLRTQRQKKSGSRVTRIRKLQAIPVMPLTRGSTRL